MMDSIRGSMLSLFWTCVMLFFVFYIFSLICMQGVSSFLAEQPNHESLSDLLFNFGSMYRSMPSFYKAGTGGADWEVYFHLLEKCGMFYASIFVFYTVFFYIAVFNILTGLFVEKVV